MFISLLTRSTGQMHVDLLLGVLVEGLEAVGKVLAASLDIAGRAGVVGEVVTDGGVLDLLLEEVDLVEEQDDGGPHEPARVADRVEECQGLLHPVDALVLVQRLVVLGDRDEEENRSYVLEAVNPLFPLGPLSPDVKELVLELSDLEVGFGDACRLDPRP